eukprot:gene10898-22749_t
MKTVSTVFILSSICLTSAFQRSPRRLNNYKPLRSSADISELHNNLFDSVNNALGLKLTDFTEVYGGKTWTEGAWSGSTEWWDETKGSKLTGVSKNSISGPDGQHTSTLNVWMGPGYVVPHLLLSIGVNPKEYDGWSVTADYVVRGSTPIGSDQSYVDDFYGKDVLQW